jgi:hypothetical protein
MLVTREKLRMLMRPDIPQSYFVSYRTFRDLSYPLTMDVQGVVANPVYNWLIADVCR